MTFRFDDRDPGRVVMSRAQRRAIKLSTDEVPIAVSPSAPIKHGERFTIAGVRREAGRWVTNCKPGDESKLVAVVCR